MSLIMILLHDSISQAVYNKKEEFFLFGSILEATMIDKRSICESCLDD